MKTLHTLRRVDAAARTVGLGLIPRYETLCRGMEAAWKLSLVQQAMRRKLRKKLPRHPLFAPGTARDPDALVRLFMGRIASNWRLAALDLCPDEVVRDAVRIVGIERLDKARDQGQGVLLVGAHYGAAHFLSLSLNRRGIANAVVAKFPQQAARPIIEHLDLIGLSQDDAVRPLLIARERLKAGETVLITGDGPYGKRVQAPFLGIEAGFPQGFATLAVATGAPMLPTFAVPGPGGRITIEFLEPIDCGESDQPRAERTEAIVRRFARVLERKWLEDPALVWWQGPELRPPLPWRASPRTASGLG